MIIARPKVDTFIELTYKLTNFELAKYFKADIRDILSWKNELVAIGHEIGYGFPESLSKKHDDYFHLNYDKVIVMGDAEIPDHDVEIFSMISDIGYKYGIKYLIINGDLVSLDSYSNWMSTEYRKLSFNEDELPCIEGVLKVFLRQFTEIIYLSGNHEKRIIYKNLGHLNLGTIIKGLERVKFSPHPKCDLISGGKEIFIVHQKNFSKVPLSIPTEIAAKEWKNVICGHNHRLAKGYDKSSKVWVVEGGHCRDDIRTSYKHYQYTTLPNWNPGFVMILDGLPHLIDKNSFNFYMSIDIK